MCPLTPKDRVLKPHMPRCVVRDEERMSRGNTRGQMLRGTLAQPAEKSRASVIVPCGLGGWTDGPPCCLLFGLSTNERPSGAQSRSNESSRVWARIESWVVQSVKRTTISPEYHGWMRVGDGNVTQLLPILQM